MTAPPSDARVLGAQFSGGRPFAPPVRLTLAKRGSDGRALEISRPHGRTRFARGGARVSVRRSRFSPANLSIPTGGIVRWKFGDRVEHDVTAVRAPFGFAGPYARRGASYQRRFTVPGAYRLYCSLHPTVMSQFIRVRRPVGRGAGRLMF